LHAAGGKIKRIHSRLLLSTVRKKDFIVKSRPSNGNPIKLPDNWSSDPAKSYGKDFLPGTAANGILGPVSEVIFLHG